MKLYVLADNCASKECQGEWGLSLFLEGSCNILFDFGASELFLENANKMGVDLSKAQYYCLSHGHWDHGNGLAFLPKNKLVCHPEVFMKRYRKDLYIGLPFSKEEVAERFEIIVVKEPYYFNENIIFLGEIPRENDFESQESIFVEEDGSKDFVMDDSAIVIKGPKGLTIISGCAHAGICNTIEYAKKVAQEEKVFAVIGGFHLKGNDELTTKTIEYLKALNIEKIIPTHCTEFPALVEFNHHFGSKQIFAGTVLEIT